MIIGLASDHAGYKLKNQLYVKLKKLYKYDCIDYGCSSSNISVDYPDYAKKLILNIKKLNYGILICGNGVGMSVVANRNQNCIAALCHSVDSVRLARKHNNANILVLAAYTMSQKKALEITDAFLNTEFEGGRHSIRVEKINNYTN